MDRVLGCVGALAGLGAVALAAVAAHVVRPAAEISMLRDAVQVQGWHALALLFTAGLAQRGGRLVIFAGGAFIFGLLAFCGPIYARVFLGMPVTFIAPYGGIALMLGWAMLAVAMVRRP